MFQGNEIDADIDKEEVVEEESEPLRPGQVPTRKQAEKK